MVARLPIPGSDDNVWGNILNEFLTTAHNSDGSLKSAAVSGAGAYSKPAGGIPAADLDSSAQTKLNSSVRAISEGNTWATSTAYGAGTIVTYSGARYLTPAGAPSASYFDTSYWILIGSVPDTF